MLAHWDCIEYDVVICVLGVDKLMERCSSPPKLLVVHVYAKSITQVMAIISIFNTGPSHRSRHLDWHPFIDDEVQEGNKDDNVEASRRSTT